MADQQLDSDSTPQRKRIAVACGRCRKRKIRCSGDPGAGQPCSNCKNAGVDECLFLRVQSREAPLRVEPGDFAYSVGDARIYANRAQMASGMSYGQDLPNLSSSDVVASYRGQGSTFPYTASKSYYPASCPSYGTPYTDEFDYSLGSPQTILNHVQDQVTMMPGHWSSRSKQSTADTAYGNMLLASDPSSYGYGGTSLVHRPAVNTDSTNFSFSGVAASLPSTTSSSERLLPIPAARSSTLPYPGPVKATAPVTGPASGTTLADVAAAASYAAGAGFDTTGLPYTSSAAGTLASHHPSTSSQRTMSSDNLSYSTGGGEAIFGEHDRSLLQSQGSAFDLNIYTAEPRRDSVSSGGGHSSATYVSSEQSAHDTHLPSQQHQQVSVTAAGYMAAADSPTSPHSHRHSLSHSHHTTSNSSSTGSTSHADSHRPAVGTRH
ncbi:hypothetical protein B0H66DRAFT_472031 [Apodospora peruviana]|uniref:Zn(2)-C6 fungal-type domain-containing protein n=1 Tax=Apodospora peruviana TaxID=516989 RepID=A0AAE0ILB5_9PEZI|nr:hypothetical protein B0H66DRAFT_472031 [Apodospora peruviana]